MSDGASEKIEIAYADIMTAIIKKERGIIGNVAIRIARNLGEIEVDDEGLVLSCNASAEGKGEILTKLIDEYKKITGEAALTVASMAIKPFFSPILKPPYKLEVAIREG